MFLVVKKKADGAFPNSQFSIFGHKLSRKVRDRFGGGIAFSIAESIFGRIFD